MPVIREKLIEIVKKTMEEESFCIKDKNILMPINKKPKYTTEIQREIMKLKLKIDDINYEFEKKPMFIYHV
jgi:hypothetical protein